MLRFNISCHANVSYDVLVDKMGMGSDFWVLDHRSATHIAGRETSSGALAHASHRSPKHCPGRSRGTVCTKDCSQKEEELYEI